MATSRSKKFEEVRSGNEAPKSPKFSKALSFQSLPKAFLRIHQDELLFNSHGYGSNPGTFRLHIKAARHPQLIFATRRSRHLRLSAALVVEEHLGPQMDEWQQGVLVEPPQPKHGSLDVPNSGEVKTVVEPINQRTKNQRAYAM